MAGTPPADIATDAALVSQLLAEQHPELLVRFVRAGWDNALFRLGDRLAVRLPRRESAVSLLVQEQYWLPKLAPTLPVAIPVPQRLGQPSQQYPWPWSIVPWLPGETADQTRLTTVHGQQLGQFLRSLHIAAPEHAPYNPFRSVSLGERAAGVEERLARLAKQTAVVTPALRSHWHRALHTPMDVAPTWIHGDLHPHNVLVTATEITGVIDWGDMARGDRATDLAALWMLLETPRVRQAAIDAYGEISAATLARAKGWATVFGVLLLEAGLADGSCFGSIGQTILQRVVQD